MTLTISGEQMEHISSLRFERRLVEIIVESDPRASAVFQSADGRAALREQCARARQHGLRSELDIAKYVISAWLLGADFDTRIPAIAELLATTRLRPSQKAEAIERIATALLTELRAGAKP